MITFNTRKQKSRTPFALSKSLIIFALLSIFAAELSFAQDSLFDEEDLFGNEDDVIETVIEADPSQSIKSFLVSDAVRIGGSFSGSIESGFKYHKPWEGGLELLNADEYYLNPSLSAMLFFDARPEENSRFYGSIKSSWPFVKEKQVLVESSPQGKDTIGIPDIKVFELFSDFSYNDSLFFRFGKQTINWGVGYFFSPANIINLEKIDVFNPEAQLEGPVALRMHYPIPASQHNLWGYAIFDAKDMKPEDTAVAAKAEFVLGPWELGAGAYYKYANPFTAMLSATGSLGKLGLFAEGTAQLGTNRKWVTKINSSPLPPYFETTNIVDYDGQWFFKASAGFMYRNSDAKISLVGQYLYDGEGYAPEDRKDRVKEGQELKALPGPNAGIIDGLLKMLIANSGRHYGALSFSRSELLLKKMSFSVFGMANLSDLSAFVKPQLSYRFFDGLSTSVSASFAFGYDDGEYVILNDGRAMGLSLSVSLGTGTF